jgi:hypothetical protein
MNTETKDDFLNFLINKGPVIRINVNESQKEFNMTRDSLYMILDHFKNLGFISIENAGKSFYEIFLKIPAYDYHSHGGFRAQEDLLSKNIQKLLLEIESLKPSMPDKISTITTIVANISTALGLFIISK